MELITTIYIIYIYIYNYIYIIYIYIYIYIYISANLAEKYKRKYENYMKTKYEIFLQ